VLDPACGEGELLRAVAEAVPADLRPRLTLTGFDTDRVAIERAQAMLADCGVSSVELYCADFLSAISESGLEPQMEFGLGAEERLNRGSQMSFDVVISNPPYVRTQVLGAAAAQRLA
jgi:adenine-specific DNA-methyltransferase